MTAPYSALVLKATPLELVFFVFMAHLIQKFS